MSNVKTRDIVLTVAIVVGFIVFQVGADWTEGAGAFLAILGLIVALGAVATFIYDKVVTDRLDMQPTEVRQPAISRFLFHDTRSAPLWLAVRLYLGFSWLEAGWEKITASAWMGGGSALKGFWERAVAVPKPPARAAITYGWYRDFLQYMLDNQWYTWFAKLIAIGELLVGIRIIVGGLVTPRRMMPDAYLHRSWQVLG